MNNKITYRKEGDYFIPNMSLPIQPKRQIGKYGRLRLNYLKNFKKGLYTELLIDGTLKQHLLDIDECANKKVQLLIKQFAESENVNEYLKEHHQMECVQTMNNIKNRAEEIVLNEIIYVYEDMKMVNFREVNDNDILKEWLDYREQEVFSSLTEEDKKHHIYFDEIVENILKNVPKQSQKYVKKQLDKLDENFMDYLCYWNEKYYRNGFVDGSQLVMGCFEE